MATINTNIGDTFGRWTVLSDRSKDDKNSPLKVLCKCSCGTEKRVRPEKLLNLSSKSCGCLRTELKTTHGMTATAVRKSSHEYWIWNMAVQRCTNPNVKNWKDYGGRGIPVCESWLKFENFFADMGKRPSDSHSLERMDNNQGYNKANCTWATRMVQMKNKRNNRNLTAFGRTQHLAAWSREFGIQHATILARIKSGWSIEDAVSSPLNSKYQKRSD